MVACHPVRAYRPDRGAGQSISTVHQAREDARGVQRAVAVSPGGLRRRLWSLSPSSSSSLPRGSRWALPSVVDRPDTARTKGENMRRSARLLAVAVLTVAGLLSGPTRADAEYTSGAVFTGTMTTSPVFSPVSPSCGLNICPATAGSYSISGSGIAVGAGDPMPNPTLLPPDFFLTGAGSMGSGSLGNLTPGAYCGVRHGSGTHHTSKWWSWSHNSSTGHWSESGSMMVMTSAAGTVPVVTLVAVVVPNPGTGSCATGTATSFTLVGVVVETG